MLTGFDIGVENEWESRNLPSLPKGVCAFPTKNLKM